MKSLRAFRIYGLLLVVMMLGGVLAACSDGGSTVTVGSTTATATTAAAGTTEATGTTAVAVTPSPVGQQPAPTQVAATTAAPSVSVIDANLKGQITVWEAISSSSPKYFNDLITTFQKAYPNAKVTVVHFSPAEIGYQVQENVLSGKLPDLIFAPADNTVSWSGLQAIQPTDKLFDKSFTDSISVNALASTKYNNVQWGVPLAYGGATVLLYNKKLVPTAPATLEDMVKLAQDKTDKASSGKDAKERTVGLYTDLNEPSVFTSLLSSYGGSMLDKSGQASLNTPEAVKTLDFMHNLAYKDKLVAVDPKANQNRQDYAFRDGKLAMMIDTDGTIARYLDNVNPTDSAATLDFAVAPLPKATGVSNYGAAYNNGITAFIGAKSSGDKLKVATTLTQWLAKPEQQSVFLDKGHVLPTSKAALDAPNVKNNAAWSGLAAFYQQTPILPASNQADAVWNAIRPELEKVIGDVAKPAEAAKQMQDNVGKI